MRRFILWITSFLAYRKKSFSSTSDSFKERSFLAFFLVFTFLVSSVFLAYYFLEQDRKSISKEEASLSEPFSSKSPAEVDEKNESSRKLTSP